MGKLGCSSACFTRQTKQQRLPI